MELYFLVLAGVLNIIIAFFYLTRKKQKMNNLIFTYCVLSFMLFLALVMLNYNLHKEKVMALFNEEKKEIIKVSSSSITLLPEKKEEKNRYLDAPLISQLPELPRGCEVTSLAMLLQAEGIKIDKMTLAEQVKKDPTKMSYKDGRIFFGNPNVGFVGDMYSYSKPGYGVYHQPIFDLAEQYLPGKMENLTGDEFTEISDRVINGKTVWVIINTTLKPLDETQFQTWETESGPIKITYKEHSVLITGIDTENVYVNDPLSNKKNLKVNKQEFITAWEQMGKQAISVKTITK
ncbi:C39 family peptidase [Metabacillus idriensis]|uniref:C39 family peptidase n=1 Tax=Metabacillus idriensis TaxID=324768 RepID=UPI0009F2BD6A|nr:C39 family peptidase [Metabacillus idriensis]MCM3597946.1 C39 family peptidase [Metabacillus idriensis]